MRRVLCRPDRSRSARECVKAHSLFHKNEIIYFGEDERKGLWGELMKEHKVNRIGRAKGICLAGTIIGAAIAVIAAASLFFKNIKLEVSRSAALFTGGFALIIVPRILGFCAHEDMACRYITAPTLAILGCAVIILSVVRLVSGVLAIRKASAAA